MSVASIYVLVQYVFRYVSKSEKTDIRAEYKVCISKCSALYLLEIYA